MDDREKGEFLNGLIQGVVDDLGGVEAAFLVFKNSEEFSSASISYGTPESVAELANEVGQCVKANARIAATAEPGTAVTDRALVQSGGCHIDAIPLVDRSGGGELDVKEIADLGFALMDDVMPRTHGWGEGIAALCFGIAAMVSMYEQHGEGGREEALRVARETLEEVFKSDIHVHDADEVAAMKEAEKGSLH